MDFYFGFSFADAHWFFFLLDFRVIFNTLFGLSTNYWMALITRCLLGVMCGYLGPIKVPNKHLVAGTHHHLHLPPFTNCSDNKFHNLLFTFHSNLFLIVSPIF